MTLDDENPDATLSNVLHQLQQERTAILHRVTALLDAIQRSGTAGSDHTSVEQLRPPHRGSNPHSCLQVHLLQLQEHQQRRASERVARHHHSLMLGTLETEVVRMQNIEIDGAVTTTRTTASPLTSEADTKARSKSEIINSCRELELEERKDRLAVAQFEMDGRGLMTPPVVPLVQPAVVKGDEDARAVEPAAPPTAATDNEITQVISTTPVQIAEVDSPELTAPQTTEVESVSHSLVIDPSRLFDDETLQRENLTNLAIQQMEVLVNEVRRRLYLVLKEKRELVSHTLSNVIEACSAESELMIRASQHEAMAVVGGAQQYAAAISRYEVADLMATLRRRALDWMRQIVPRGVLKSTDITELSMRRAEQPDATKQVFRVSPTHRSSPRDRAISKEPSGPNQSRSPSCEHEPRRSSDLPRGRIRSIPDLTAYAPPSPVAIGISLTPHKPLGAPLSSHVTTAHDRMHKFDAQRKARIARNQIGHYSPSKSPVTLLPLQGALLC